MRHTLSLILVVLLSYLSLLAQNQKPTFYKNELSFGGGFHTRGFNISTTYVMTKSNDDAFFGVIDFGEIRSPSEKRVSLESLTIGSNRNRSFIYGKQNSLFVLRAGGGQRHYISEKPDKSIVALAFVYSGGFTLGMLKPYYLDLIYRFDPIGYSVRSEPFRENNRYKFLDPLDINGATGFSAGWDELAIAPGLFFKGGLLFDWGPRDNISKMLEIGISTDIFFRNIPIMVDEVKAPFFFNLYMNFYLGKRW